MMRLPLKGVVITTYVPALVYIMSAVCNLKIKKPLNAGIVAHTARGLTDTDGRCAVPAEQGFLLLLLRSDPPRRARFGGIGPQTSCERTEPAGCAEAVGRCSFGLRLLPTSGVHALLTQERERERGTSCMSC